MSVIRLLFSALQLLRIIKNFCFAFLNRGIRAVQERHGHISCEVP